MEKNDEEAEAADFEDLTMQVGFRFHIPILAIYPRLANPDRFPTCRILLTPTANRRKLQPIRTLYLNF